MLVVDELKKNDPQLRLVALMLVAGLFVLFAGLWWVQVVSTHEYQIHQEAQAYRTVRLPAIRGKILDRNGRVLAENRARYNLCLYFDDLNTEFKAEYDRIRPVKVVVTKPPFWKFWSHASTVQTNRVKLKLAQMDAVGEQARVNVGSRIVAELSRELGEPIPLDYKKFLRSYAEERALPFTLVQDLNDQQIARFQENYNGGMGVQVVLEPVREYPYNTMAAHVLGELRKDEKSLDGEMSYFDYRLPDYCGETGIEGKYDAELHGHAGVESVVVNNLGYRVSQDVDTPPEPGADVTLTLDLDLQRAAEQALADGIAKHGGNTINGSVVVMDVRTGDVLAMVSTPAFNPNDFADGISVEKYQALQELQAEKNRATFENYAPGSIFKTVVALAALENGLNPDDIYDVQANPREPGHGAYFFSARSWMADTAPPGKYNFQRAFIHSSNSYFINAGLKAGVENVVKIGEQFHLGERTGLFTGQETPGNFPKMAKVQARDWHDGDTGNLCIGQGVIDVTPIQMAVMVSTIANGGTVLWPRLVEKLAPQDPNSGMTETNFPAGRIRDHLRVHPRSLQILRAAMRADVESNEGTGQAAAVTGMNVCAKTGTAQVKDEHGRTTGHNYWFASYAPYENPRYAVVVLMQSDTLGGSGGGNCAPVAHDVYEAIVKKEAPQPNVAMK